MELRHALESCCFPYSLIQRSILIKSIISLCFSSLFSAFTRLSFFVCIVCCPCNGHVNENITDINVVVVVAAVDKGNNYSRKSSRGGGGKKHIILWNKGKRKTLRTHSTLQGTRQTTSVCTRSLLRT